MPHLANRVRVQTPPLDVVRDWLQARRWIGHLVLGVAWLYLAIAAYGTGQAFAVQLAFTGMLVWALTESDKCEYVKLLEQALKLVDEAINGWKAERK